MNFLGHQASQWENIVSCYEGNFRMGQKYATASTRSLAETNLLVVSLPLARILALA